MYYVKLWDYKSKSYNERYSIGVLKNLLGEKAREIPHINKAGSDKIVRMWLNEGSPIESKKGFIEYLETFWETDSEYVKSKKLRGQNISAAYLANNRSAISKHAAPYLETHTKRNLLITQVTPGLLENMLIYLSDATDLSHRRINAILQAVSVPLSEAKRLGDIKINPAESVNKLMEKKVERKILNPVEVKKFFSQPIGDDPRFYAINLLAATTGMRLGECRGLLKQNLHEGWIDIRENTNWVDGEGLKNPKWGSIRSVPLPVKTYEILKSLIDTNPWRNDFIFYGTRDDLPISKRMIENYFKNTLLTIKISDENRKSRGLNFHAWRHFYNSMLRGHIPDHALRKLTGHKNDEMTDHYSSVTDDQREAVAKLAESII